ncbi:MAG: hypothetical protein NXH75_02310 [Halobacteriovoraceae bacterium]|nr:hypothetical protein [Halobacteriovoraceae bacterium]
MKKAPKTLILLTFLTFSLNIFGDSKVPKGKARIINKTEKVIGQIIKPEKKLNLPYEYYITIQRSDGKVQAFPFKSKKINPRMMIKNRYYYMDVYPTNEKVTIGEKTQTIHVMNLKSAKLITMKELGMSPPTEDGVEGKDPVFRNKKGNIKRGPDFRMNDKVTNSLIFAAGATLLYSILAN